VFYLAILAPSARRSSSTIIGERREPVDNSRRVGSRTLTFQRS
jgi:hypothetical protein